MRETDVQGQGRYVVVVRDLEGQRGRPLAEPLTDWLRAQPLPARLRTSPATISRWIWFVPS